MDNEIPPLNFSGLPFVLDQSSLPEPLIGSYSAVLAGLSIALACFASYVALIIARQVRDAPAKAEKSAWVGAGALVLGCGVWSMHFLGMLAYALPIDVHYDLRLTALSIVPGILAGVVVVHIIARDNSSWRHLLPGAILVGAGIGTMHFTGMAAMRMQASMVYDPYWFGASVLIAILLAYFALAAQFKISKLKNTRFEKRTTGISAGAMGLAISGMHYTAMAAISYFPKTQAQIQTQTQHMHLAIDGALLAIPMVLFGVMIGSFFLIVAATHRHAMRASIMKAFFEESLDGVIVADERGIILEFSPSAERMFGHQASDILGENVATLMRPSERAVHDTHLDRFSKTSQSTAIGMRRELQGLRKDGSHFPVEIGLSTASVGGRKMLIGTMHDITARLELERAEKKARKAERANQVKADFLATMSHEIRTPINGFMGMMHLLELTKPTDEQARYLEAAKESASTLTTLLNDILDFSRLGAHKVELLNVPLNLRDLLDSVCEAWRGIASGKGLELRTEFDADLPEYIVADGTRLRQVLFNLVSNATKFTDRGSITVRCKASTQDGGRVHLRFETEDTGIGLSPEEQIRVFEAFEQADVQTHQKHGGTGLGLAICKSIVELYKGQIGVDSVEPQGCNFWFEADFEAASPPERVHSEGRVSRETSRASIKLLVAEDNIVNRTFLEILFEKMELDAELVENGAEALERLRATNFDAILMDIQMPVMDGETALRHIRDLADPAKANVPVIAVTANAMAGDKKRYKDLGFDGYVSKPIDPAVLREEIDRLTSDTQPADLMVHAGQ